MAKIRVTHDFIADEGHVDAGRELTVSEQRAIELVSVGVAVRLDARPLEQASGDGSTAPLETKPEPAKPLETKPEPAPKKAAPKKAAKS